MRQVSGVRPDNENGDAHVLHGLVLAPSGHLICELELRDLSRKPKGEAHAHVSVSTRRSSGKLRAHHYARTSMFRSIFFCTRSSIKRSIWKPAIDPRTIAKRGTPTKQNTPTPSHAPPHTRLSTTTTTTTGEVEWAGCAGRLTWKARLDAPTNTIGKVWHSLSSAFWQSYSAPL